MDAAALVTPYNHISFKRRKNTWYTIASGNWSDPNIWMSNSRRRYAYPQAGDDVSIGLGHTVTFNTAANSTTVVNNLYVAGTLSTLGQTGFRTLSVLGDLQATGSVNLTQTSNNPTLNLSGVNNYISSFTAGASTVAYVRENGDQPIMDLSYFNLTVDKGGTKYLTNNISIAGGLNVGLGNPAFLTTFESSTFNVSVTGATTVLAGGFFSKTGAGSLLFTGLLSYPNNTTTPIQGLVLSGNPTVEFRGGWSFSGIVSSVFITGTNTWSYTTNSQTTTVVDAVIKQFTCPMSVVGAITVTNAAGGGGAVSLNAPIDNTVAGGSVINKGTIYFNSTSSLPSFATGTFDRTSFANTVGYTMGASITLPYTSYYSLYISNSGTKTLLGNTTLLGTLLENNSSGTGAVLELATYDLSVGSTTQLWNGTTLSKTGSGNVIFGGQFSIVQNSVTVNFSGNPTMEFRSGFNNAGGNIQNMGTGVASVTTNTQTFSNSSGVGNITFNSIAITGAITLNVTGNAAFNVNSINGTVAGSTLANAGVLYMTSSTAIMTTGVFNNSSTANTLGFVFDGDYTLPYANYRSLFIGGTGTKTASANIVLQENLTVGNGSASMTTLEMGSFNLTTNGTATLSLAGTISKTGTGNVLFTGLLTFANLNTFLTLTGNPSLELRGGVTFSSGTNPTLTGSPVLTFSTNNQTITNSGGTATIPYAIIVSGAITLTESGAGTTVLTGVLNGNNAASTFDNRGTVQYQATQQPMLTGVLQTNLAANTFLYNGNNSQNITSGTYRTLTLGGTATPNNKTLQGNIVVATAYSVTGNAVLVLNGFTKT